MEKEDKIRLQKAIEKSLGEQWEVKPIFSKPLILFASFHQVSNDWIRKVLLSCFFLFRLQFFSGLLLYWLCIFSFCRFNFFFCRSWNPGNNISKRGFSHWNCILLL